MVYTRDERIEIIFLKIDARVEPLEYSLRGSISMLWNWYVISKKPHNVFNNERILDEALPGWILWHPINPTLSENFEKFFLTKCNFFMNSHDD